MNEHLSDETLKALQQNRLSIDEKLDVLSHISTCEDCAARFSARFQELIPPPPDLEQGILNKIHQTQKSSPSLFLYSLRVTIAACIAITLLFSGMFTKWNFEIRPPDGQKLNQLSGEMRNFTNKIINWEVYKYDQKER